MAGDRDAVPAPDEALRQLEHQPDAATATGLAADVVMDESDVQGPAMCPAGRWINNVARIVSTPPTGSDDEAARPPVAAQPDLLDSTEAGGSVIRGSALRLGGHVLGALAGVAVSAVVIRQLGVVDTGRFVTVMSLVVIAGSISDLGLSAVGVREYAVRPPDEGHRLLRNLLGMRLAFVALGVGAATAFAVLAGYGSTMVLGTLVAGVGMTLFVTQQSLAIPLHVRLRFGAVAGLLLLGQIGVAIAAVLLALAGAGLLAFLAMNIPATLAVLVLTVLVGGAGVRVLPAFDDVQWRRLLRQILPYSAAVVLSVLYFRVAQIMISLLSSGEETGFFGVSFRVLETLTTIPALLVSTALPILARAARDDSERFAYAGRRLAETMLIAGAGLAIVLFLGAKFCIDVVAGSGFDRSVDVLRILAFALVGTFVIAARGYALLSVDSMRAILVSNAIALGVVAVAGVPMISAHGAVGAALTLLAAELTLAACYEVALTRRRAELRMTPGFVARVTLAALVALVPVLLLDLTPVLMAAIGGIVYLAALAALGAVPAELREALSRRPGTS
jgi:O-antigen/teichoic acid export membrane protein